MLTLMLLVFLVKMHDHTETMSDIEIGECKTKCSANQSKMLIMTTQSSCPFGNHWLLQIWTADIEKKSHLIGQRESDQTWHISRDHNLIKLHATRDTF